ncbi:hypothetical protein [Paraburkholderia sp. BCC1886]|uniref:hypothetical protein n=1 Tax=Paraburkholderia sp. BCC1886 TaxID=2562670 RepID=UPI001182D62B|nr:hypothetical protein [Paraburkholderia sp. BCC1886]
MITDIRGDNRQLLFKGEKYPVGKLLGLMAQAPLIDVPRDDINVADPILYKDFCVELENCDSDEHRALQYGDIAFFKQEGKFTVLLGRQKALDAQSEGLLMLRGRLISTPALKKIRVDDRPIITASNETERRYPAQSRPRENPYRSDSRAAYRR